ncbi:Hypothetical predicted protein [Octopus vulgaris]|uniref:Uncharacterized protein n=1 Tax=Octopus vulgaris TaxID=6645 RepID=A0AA36AMS8_OCTVU|nr:Hypothetical predicted protein [Octopus vulgaris]
MRRFVTKSTEIYRREVCTYNCKEGFLKLPFCDISHSSTHHQRCTCQPCEFYLRPCVETKTVSTWKLKNKRRLIIASLSIELAVVIRIKPVIKNHYIVKMVL